MNLWTIARSFPCLYVLLKKVYLCLLTGSAQTPPCMIYKEAGAYAYRNKIPKNEKGKQADDLLPLPGYFKPDYYPVTLVL